MADPKVELRITAQDQTRAAIQSVRQGLNSLTKQIGALRTQALAIGAAFVAFRTIVRPLGDLAREAIDTGDDLLALSQRTGITVENLSALSHVARLANADINTVATGAKRLSVTLLDAGTGSKKAQQLLSAFGITAKDDLLVAFQKISERLKDLPDGWEKNALAVKLFGKAGDQLVPFLNELSAGLDDAQRKNVIFSTSVAKASDSINDSLTTIREQLVVTFARALESTLPKVQAFLGAVQEGLASGGFTGGLDAILAKLQEFGGLLGSVARVLREHGEAVLTVIKAYVGFRILVGIRGLILPFVEALFALGRAAAVAGSAAAGLRVALLALGGPIGIIATAVTGLGAAFLLLGQRANESGTTAGRAVGAAKDAAARFRQELELGTASSAEIAATMEQSKQSLEAQSAIIADNEKRLKTATGREAAGLFEGLKRARGEAAELTGDIEKLGNQFDTAKRKEDATAAAAGTAGKAQADALAGLLGQLDKTKTGGGAGKVASDAKALIESSLAAVQDALEREQRALDQALEDELVSFRDFYERRTAIALAAIDAEIAAKREALAVAKDQGDIARITSEITVLERKRGDVAVQARRDQITAERELADQLAEVRARVLEAEGRTAEATRIRLDAEFRELTARLQVEGDAAGVELVKRLFNIEAARGQLDQLQGEYDRFREALTREESRINVEVETGLTSELAGRRELVRLHVETADRLRPIAAQMQAIAATIGPEEISRVAGLTSEVETLGIVTNEVGQSLNNEFKVAAADAFADFIRGTTTAQEAFANFGDAVLSAIAQIAAQNLAEELFGNLFSSTKRKGEETGSDFLGLFSSLFGLFHQGGIVGLPGPGRRVPALAFAGAPRLEQGGILGLRTNEVPAILHRGEEVLTRDDPRHRANQGAGNVTVVMNISTQDLASFRRASGQIAVEASTAIGRAARNRP